MYENSEAILEAGEIVNMINTGTWERYHQTTSFDLRKNTCSPVLEGGRGFVLNAVRLVMPVIPVSLDSPG